MRKAPKLNPWNPVDQLRLLWWLLNTPQKYRDFTHLSKWQQVFHVNTGLTSTLIVLPMLIPTTAFVFGVIPRNYWNDVISVPNIGWLSSPTFALCLIAISWCFIVRVNHYAHVSTLGVVFIFGIMLMSIIVIGNVVFGFIQGVIVGFVYFIIYGITTGITTGVDGYLRSGTVFGLTSFFSYLSILMACVVVVMLKSSAGGLCGTILFAVLSISVGLGIPATMGTVEEAIQRTLKNLSPTLTGRQISIVFLLAYGVMIWMYWLGGWQVFGFEM